MSSTVDDRVVEMRFDNKQFESNVQTTMSTLDKLKQSLKMTEATKGLEDIDKAAQNTNVGALGSAVESVQLKFSALQTIATTALVNITNSALNAGKNIASALTIDPITSGFEEYETQINAVQTILANTSSKGSTLEDVNAALDELNTYADKTIYNFTEMTKNIGTFTAAGVDLETSTKAIQGIANVAAVSGSTSQQASTAMYQLSQALANGKVALQDWNSVVNAGMGGEVFQTALKRTATNMGTDVDALIEKYGSFRESLTEGAWLTTDVLTETLNQFAGAYTDAELLAQGYSEEQVKEIQEMATTATDAATKVKTFTQLFDTLKEAAQSGWTQTWEIIIGDFEEAKSLLTEISDTLGAVIQTWSDTRNNMLQGWSDLGGRDSLINIFTNLYNSLISVISPIKEAFSDIFPATTSEQLYGITKAIEEFTSKLILTDTQSDNLRNTCKGLFSILDIGLQVFKSIAVAVAPIVVSLGKLAVACLGLLSPIGELLTGVDSTAKKTDMLNTALQTISKVIQTVIGVITSLVTLASDKLNEFFDIVKENFSFPGFEMFQAFLVRFSTRCKQITTSTENMRDGVTTAIKDMGYVISNSSFGKAMNKLWDIVKTVSSSIVSSVGDMANKVMDKLGNADFNGAFDILNEGLIVGLGIGLKQLIDSLTSVVKDTSGFIGGISDIKDAVIDTFGAIQTQLKAKTLLMIAGAIGILAASLLIISTIDSDKLATSLAGISGLFVDLMASMAVFTKFSGNMSGTFKATTMMIGMSTSILVLATALKKLSSIDSEGMAQGLVGIASLMAMIVASSIVLSKNSSGAISGATSMVIFAAAIKVLASACSDLSELSWEGIAKGLVGVGALLAEVSLFLNTASFGNKAISTATGILIMSAAIKVLASACSDFGNMDTNTIIKGLGSIAVILTELMLFTNLTGDSGKVISTATSLVIIAASMKIFASAVSDFGSMDSTTITKGLYSMAVALLEVVIAMNLLPKNMIASGTGLAVVAASMLILASAMGKMAGFSWTEIAKGLTAMGGALAELAIGLNLMNGTLAGSAALIIAASAMAILAPSLSLLGSMSWEGIAKGMVALAGAFTIMGVAGALLSPLIPSIAALSASFALLGIGVVAIGAGLLTAGIGLQALAVGFTALAAAGAAGATSLVASFSIIILGIANLIPAVMTQIGLGIVQICQTIIAAAPVIVQTVTTIVTSIITALTSVIPLVVEGIFTLLTSVLTTLADYTPTIVQAVLDILTACLTGIANNISQIIQAGIDIVIGVIDGISQKIPDVIQAGFDLVISFITGLTDAINNNTQTIVDAMNGLVKAMANACITMIKGQLSLIKDAITYIMDSGIVKSITDKVSAVVDAAEELMDNVKSTIEGFVDKFFEIGGQIISGLINGIKDKATDLVDAAEGVVDDAVDGAKNLLGIHSPSRVFAQIGRYVDEGFIVGLKDYAGKVADATADVGQTAIDSMNNVISGVSDTLSSNLDTQPTITPVVDLSSVESGAKALNGMFDDSQSVGVMANIKAVNSMMNQPNQNGNDDVVSAIDKLRKDLGSQTGTSYNINGVTYDDGSNVANAVKSLVRATRIESRV